MTRPFKTLILVVTIPALLVTIFLLYLNFSDLGVWRESVGRMISKSLGREIVIYGVFEPEFGLTTRIIAENITLSNADWGSQPSMLSVDRLEVEIGLLSVLFPPVRIDRLMVDGVWVLLEVSDEGRSNWQLKTGSGNSADSSPLGLSLGEIDLTRLEVVSLKAASGTKTAVGIDRLSIRDEETGGLDFTLDGHVDSSAFFAEGRVSPLAGLLQGSELSFDFSGRLGNTSIACVGKVEDLKTMERPNFTAEIDGADLAELGEIFGLSDFEHDPFRLGITVRPVAQGNEFDLDISTGHVTCKIAGLVDSLSVPAMFDLNIEASGENAAMVGSLVGIADIPAESFSISGHARWAGFPIVFDEVKLRLGDTMVSADGILGQPPLMTDTDFTFSGKGADISWPAAIFGVDLPKDEFSVEGRVVRLEKALEFEGVDIRIGQTALNFEGILGDPPQYDDTSLTLRGKTPDLSHFQGLSSVGLPHEEFEFDCRLSRGHEAITVERARVRLGSSVVEIDGHLSTTEGFVGTDLRIRARGPDASRPANLAGFDFVPAEVWTAGGRVKVLHSDFLLEGAAANIGGFQLKAEGQVEKGLEKADLQFHIEDASGVHVASVTGIFDLPPGPLRLDGRLRVDVQGYRVDGLVGLLDDIAFEVDGRIGSIPGFAEGELQIAIRGPRFSTLGVFFGQPDLPNAPFAASGTLRRTKVGFELEGVAADLWENHLLVDGSIVPGKGLVGSDLRLDLAGPDLGSLVRQVSGREDLLNLPAEPFSVSGRVVASEAGYRLENTEAAVADTRARVSGQVGLAPAFDGTDLNVNIEGSNAALISALIGVSVPELPFRLEGRVGRLDSLLHVHSVSAQLGQHTITLDGTLGDVPKLIGTDLKIHAEGPSLAVLGELWGLENFPDQPYFLVGRFDGTTDRFSAENLIARVGPSDLKGSFEIAITGKPMVRGELTSNFLDLRPLFKRINTEEAPVGGTSEVSSAEEKGFVFSDDEIDLTFLRWADAEGKIRAKELILPPLVVNDIDIGFRLDNGRLEIEHITARDDAQGSLTGNLILEPGEEACRLKTHLQLRKVRPNLSGSTVAFALQPPIDLELDIEAHGGSLHDLAASADGRIQVVVAQGELDPSALEILSADLLVEILRILNPFSAKEKATILQCAVLAVEMDDGRARLEPLAIQTDKVTILAKGAIDLSNERLDLEWVSKPRKGLGLAATMITNSSIKLGGTLSNPSLQLNEVQAVASTGVAFVTVGLSLVAKGLFNRITADQDVCQDAIETIADRSSKPPTH